MMIFNALLTTSLLSVLVAAGTLSVPSPRASTSNQTVSCSQPQVIGPYYVQSGQRTYCLGVGKPAPGAPVILIDCALTDAITANWCIGEGPNPSVGLVGTSFCLDAGNPPKNNAGVSVSECSSGAVSQGWTYTNNGGRNNTIALTKGNQCLDRKDGTGLFLQTYECTTANVNDNQQWVVLPAPWFIGS